MNKINVQSLNKVFNVDGPNWIIEDPNCYEILSTPDISPWNKGMSGVIFLSEETKKKMSLSRKGQIPWNKGLKCDEEKRQFLKKISKIPKPKHHGENVSKSMKGNPNVINVRKKHYIITFNDGRVEYVFGIVEWCKINGYSDRGLYRFLSGKRKKYKDIRSVEKVTTNS